MSQATARTEDDSSPSRSSAPTTSPSPKSTPSRDLSTVLKGKPLILNIELMLVFPITISGQAWKVVVCSKGTTTNVHFRPHFFVS
ncbi:unnamed protein product [Linum trigynum]|uniref:Uncharacterized protein n=1 Tax=Linum trigynum TaxID=586398 RepID=A0AAV2DFV2_9ROSI